MHEETQDQINATWNASLGNDEDEGLGKRCAKGKATTGYYERKRVSWQRRHSQPLCHTVSVAQRLRVFDEPYGLRLEQVEQGQPGSLSPEA